MEFYSSVTVSKWISECFNSQRDGILLLLPSQFVLNALAFQFPTGWNSTVGNTGIAVTRKLFQFPTGWNSTKPDGFVDKLTAVSIPNGMEFYEYGVFSRSWEKSFQFPTGWNSTHKRHSANERFLSFNSQRDGILHEYARSLCDEKGRFNSQRDGILRKVIYTIRAEFEGFNSQRDGILLSPFAIWAGVKRSVSIPNGMEFYRKTAE